MLTDITPRITRLVDIHGGSVDIGGVAKEWQPHIFNVEVVEGLVYRPIEFMTLGVPVSGDREGK